MSSTLMLTDANFADEIKKATVPVLVDFWAPWCGPCKAVAPILDELAVEYKDRLIVAKMNVDENPKLPAQFQVRSIPFIVLLKDGEVVGNILGSKPKSDFNALIDPWL